MGKSWENHGKNGKIRCKWRLHEKSICKFWDSPVPSLQEGGLTRLLHRDLNRSNPGLRCVIELFQGFANFVLAFRARGRRQYYVYNYARFILQIRWYNGGLLSYVFLFVMLYHKP